MRLEEVTAEAVESLTNADLLDLRARALQLSRAADVWRQAVNAHSVGIGKSMPVSTLLTSFGIISDALSKRQVEFELTKLDRRLLSKRMRQIDVADLPILIVKRNAVVLTGKFVTDPRHAPAATVLVDLTTEGVPEAVAQRVGESLALSTGQGVQLVTEADCGPAISVYDLVLVPKDATVEIAKLETPLLSRDLDSQVATEIHKDNPNHDDHGRFAESSGGGAGKLNSQEKNWQKTVLRGPALDAFLQTVADKGVSKTGTRALRNYASSIAAGNMKGAVATIGGMGANAREYAHMMFSDAKDKVGGAASSSQKVSLVDFPGLSENVAAQVQPGVLAKIPPELRKYAGQVTIGSRDASDRAEGVQQLGETFSDMKRSGKIVAPEDPTRPYMPANKLKDGTILWHPDAVIHGHVMDLAGGGEFAGRRKDVVSSGGIAPSGEYYDQGTIGDINERWTAAVRSLKKVDEPVSFIKAAEQRLVGGLVYEPNVVDGQGDYVPTAVEIWKGIETWAESGHTIKFMHDGRPLRGKVLPVEIFQAEKDTHKGGGIIPAGAWYLCCKVLDDKLWAACKSGEITGFSMSGSALASVEKMGVFEGRADAAASSGKAAVEKAGEGNPNHDELGRFAEGDSSGGPGEFVTLGKDATGHHTHDDPAIQERIKSLVLPPAWTNVKLSADPKAELQAVGTDSKGRQQYVYSAEHSAKASAEKFERLKQFTAELPAIRSRRENDLNSPTSPHHDDATALYLIDKTGFRIGGSKDTQADQHAYGASTLTADHVKIDGDKVAFDFIGKHGVRIQQEVEDSRLASLLAPKLARGGRLFDTDDNRLRGYLHSIDGEFKVKDFRTLKAAETALTTMRGMAAPTDMKSYKAQRNAVGDAVAAKLGNTRTVALSSYIPPEVFSKWKI